MMIIITIIIISIIISLFYCFFMVELHGDVIIVAVAINVGRETCARTRSNVTALAFCNSSTTAKAQGRAGGQV